jgi:hypothetical protein
MRRTLLPAFAAVAAVYVVSAVLSFTLPAHPVIGIGIAIDLTLTAAALFWLLAVRPGHAKPAALIRVLVLGLAMARLLVGISALGMVAIAIEAGVSVYLIVRARRLVRHVRALRADGHGLAGALDTALRSVIPVPAVASVLAMEVATVIFAITGWFRSPPDGFAMHRRSGVVMIIGVLAALAVVEAVVMHIVLVRVSPVLAIVATALSAYGLLWLVGFAHAVRLSPLRFTAQGLVIERGVTRRAIVPAHAVARAVPVTAASDDAVDLSYTEPNLLLELSTPVDVHGPLGRAKSATKLLLSIDDRDAFLAQLARAKHLDDRVVDGAAE